MTAVWHFLIPSDSLWVLCDLLWLISWFLLIVFGCCVTHYDCVVWHVCWFLLICFWYCVTLDCVVWHVSWFLIVCPSHKWGPHCRHDCTCQNGAKCDARTGACACTPGWQGDKCDKPCDQGYYGDKCQYSCSCFNGATCDPVAGNCTCSAGYKGTRWLDMLVWSKANFSCQVISSYV